MTIEKMEPIVKSVFGCSVKELKETSKTYDKDTELKLTEEDVKGLRRSMKVHECRTLYKDKWENGEVLTIMRAALSR